MLRKRFQYDKLVRDKTLERLNTPGVEVDSYVLDADAYTSELSKKLLEETQEVIAVQSREELTKELADVIEVVHALAKNAGITLDEIEQARQLCFKERGGFYDRIFIKSVIFPSDHKFYSYCLDNDDRYPELPL